MYKIFVTVISVLFVLSSNASADRTVLSPPLSQNWQSNAKKFLDTYKLVRKINGNISYKKLDKVRPFSPAIDKFALRCVRMNNYGCFWQRSRGSNYPRNWQGTPGPSGKNGAHDGTGGSNGHAIFEHPKWSIVAAYQWFERLTNGGQKRRSAFELAQIYAPWCDTIGSGGTKTGDIFKKTWGRSCVGGKKPPASFRGPICRKRKNPSRQQCDSCNCPNNIASYWLKGINALESNKGLRRTKISDPLELFDKDGRPTSTFKLLIKWKVGLEIGAYMPNRKLFEEADNAFIPTSFE